MRIPANLEGAATLLLDTRSGGRLLVSEQGCQKRQVGRREEKADQKWLPRRKANVAMGEGSRVGVRGL